MKLNLVKNLEPLVTAKLAQIDEDANRALLSFRTSSDYTAVVYALKRAELASFDAGEKTVEELVMLNAEAAALGETAETVLATWRLKISSEDAALPRIIEAQRQAFKQRVREAKNPAEIEAAYVSEGADWSGGSSMSEG